MHDYRERDLFPANMELEYNKLKNNLGKFKEELMRNQINVLGISTKEQDHEYRLGCVKTITINCFIEKITTIKTYILSYDFDLNGASKNIEVYDAQMQYMSPEVNDYLTINAIRKVIKHFKDKVEEKFDVYMSPYTYITKENERDRFYYIGAEHRIIKTPDLVWVLDNSKGLTPYSTTNFKQYSFKDDDSNKNANEIVIKNYFKYFLEYIDNPQLFKYKDGMYVLKEKLIEDIESSVEYNYYKKKIYYLTGTVTDNLNFLLVLVISLGIVTSLLTIIFSLISPIIPIAITGVLVLLVSSRKRENKTKISKLLNKNIEKASIENNTYNKSYILLTKHDSLIKDYNLNYFDQIKTKSESDTNDEEIKLDFLLTYFGDDEQMKSLVRDFNSNAISLKSYLPDDRNDLLLDFHLPKLAEQVSHYDSLSMKNKYFVESSIMDANKIIIDKLKVYRDEDERNKDIDIKVLHDQIKEIKDNL